MGHSIKEAPKIVQIFYMFFSVLIREYVPHRRQGGRKTRLDFALSQSSTLVKIRGGWAKCLSEFFEFNLGPNF